ncbi:MAG: TatD family hydrolase, partial [Phocaeicola sp.]
ADEASRLLEYPHFFLGINGTVTFKKSILTETLKNVPLERLVIETDSPYLAPVPFRGRRNESGHIIYVANRLSDLYEVSEGIVAEITTQNALTLFNIGI